MGMDMDMDMDMDVNTPCWITARQGIGSHPESVGGLLS
jgi:hypothetical protein